MAEKATAQTTENDGTAETRKRLKEEKKRLREEQKAQKKEARKKAKELEAQEDELDEEADSGSTPVVLVTLIIVIVWLAILALLIKLDVGGFGSGVLRPILKNVPVAQLILPTEKMENPGDPESNQYNGYTSLKDAVDQIKKLELELENAQNGQLEENKQTEELKAEIERLKTFENNQIAFEKIKNEFYDEVVYSDKGPGAEAYQKYYESMDPETAAEMYKQVVQKLQEDGKVKEYATAYSEMKPKEAAKIFEAMTDNLDLAAKILKAMDATDRGKILGAMNADVAAKITKIMDPVS